MPDSPCILIVDDEPNVRLMLRTALESAGYRVQEAADGCAVLAYLRGHACDLIVLDLRMPRLDGMQTLAGLREQGNATPVVMLTAHGSIPDAVAAMRLGAIDFLTKPVTPAELRAIVSEVIGRDAARPDPTSGTASAARSSFAFGLAHARRAINRGEFDEAERLLREILAEAPRYDDARTLLDRLLALDRREAAGSSSLLRERFPDGVTDRRR